MSPGRCCTWMAVRTSGNGRSRRLVAKVASPQATPVVQPQGRDMSNAFARSTNLLSGLSASNQPSRLLRLYATLAGAAVIYPWLLVGFYASGRRAVSGGSEAIFG